MTAINGLGGNANALSLLSQQRAAGSGTPQAAGQLFGELFSQPDSRNSGAVTGAPFASSLQSLLATQTQVALIQAQADQSHEAPPAMADALFKALDTSGTGTVAGAGDVGPGDVGPRDVGPGDASAVASASPASDGTATDAVDRLLKDFFGMSNRLASGALSASALGQLLAQQQQQRT